MAASITVRRTKDSWQDLARAYTVLIDGTKAGKLRRGKELTVELEPGEHEVQMKIDWTKSEKQTLQLNDGETAEFLCSPPGTTKEATRAATTAVLGKEGYIQLERV
ncbi:MAG: hypothetical protein M3355_07785 [Actinomycetota bacterium]|nr:hypothetical protein [Actinomycetota bacterium]